jgi:hypothetical protein
MNTSLPIIAQLNPPPVAPEGLMAIDSPVLQGLPHAVPLLPRWRAVLVLPSGLVRPWLELPADMLVSSDAEDAAPMPAREPPASPARPGPRLRLQLDGRTVATLPLAAGLLADVAADNSLRLRLLVRGWALHAGTLRGPGQFGSALRLSVAAADAGVNSFGPLPPSPAVTRRLPPADRMESRAGLAVVLRLRRLTMLKERLR